MVERKVKQFQDLFVWQKAHQLVLDVYNTTKNFPKDELYGLVSQIRRSAVSIAANIAEGYRKPTKLEKQRFLSISHASLEETRYYLILSKDLGYCDSDRMLGLAEEVSKLLKLYYRKIADFR